MQTTTEFWEMVEHDTMQDAFIAVIRTSDGDTVKGIVENADTFVVVGAGSGSETYVMKRHIVHVSFESV